VLSLKTIGTSSLQSRCLAGVATASVIFRVAGSTRCRVTTAWNRADQRRNSMAHPPPAIWCNCATACWKTPEQAELAPWSL